MVWSLNVFYSDTFSDCSLCISNEIKSMLVFVHEAILMMLTSKLGKQCEKCGPFHMWSVVNQCSREVILNTQPERLRSLKRIMENSSSGGEIHSIC